MNKLILFVLVVAVVLAIVSAKKCRDKRAMLAGQCRDDCDDCQDREWSCKRLSKQCDGGCCCVREGSYPMKQFKPACNTMNRVRDNDRDSERRRKNPHQRNNKRNRQNEKDPE